MERWRWLPHDLGAFYVTVNIPEFMLRVVEDEQAHLHHPRRRRQDRQADADLLQRDAGRSCSVRIGTCRTRSRSRRSGPISAQEGGWFWRRRLEHRGPPAPRSARQYGGREVDPVQRSTGTASISATSRSISRRDPATCSARSNSCSPTSTTSTCTTRRRSPCSPTRCAPRAMAACGCRTPISWPLTLLKRDQGWSQARIVSAIERLRPAHSAAAEDSGLRHLLHP